MAHIDKLIWNMISCLYVVRATVLAFKQLLVHPEQSFHKKWLKHYTWNKLHIKLNTIHGGTEDTAKYFCFDQITWLNLENGDHFCASGWWSFRSTASVLVGVGIFCIPAPGFLFFKSAVHRNVLHGTQKHKPPNTRNRGKWNLFYTLDIVKAG